jgi:hypothetical protein
MQPTNIRDKILPEPNENSNNDDDPQRTRSTDEVGFDFYPINELLFSFKLRDMLKTLVRIRYKDIEDEFKRLDRGSYGELTPDLLYNLFKRFVDLFE